MGYKFNPFTNKPDETGSGLTKSQADALYLALLGGIMKGTITFDTDGAYDIGDATKRLQYLFAHQVKMPYGDITGNVLNADSEESISLASTKSVDMKGSNTGYINFYNASTWVATIRLSDGRIRTKNTLLADALTASKVVFTDSSKQLTSTGIGTSAQFIKGDGSLDSTTHTKHFRLTIIDPATAYGVTPTFCITPKLSSAITVTNLEVTCDANPTTEPTGDLKYADTYIGKANSTVINDFDTTAGVRSDSSMTNGSVASGKAVYLSFDTTPDSALKSITFDISYTEA